MANAFTAETRSTTASVVLSALMIVAGLLAISVPMIAGVAVTALIGWLLLVSGFFHLAFAWRPAHSSSVLGQILLGIVYGEIGRAHV